MEEIKEKWFESLRELKKEYCIHVGDKIDEKSCRRIAILVSELFVTTITNKDSQMSFYYLEPETYRVAREHRLHCDPLEREERNPKKVDMILKIWGQDKSQGCILRVTNIEEWLMPLWEEENGRKTIGRERSYGNLELEKGGIGSNERKRPEVHKGL